MTTTQQERTPSRYVLGFMFSLDYRYVVLIRKIRPDWMVGKWNGIGGHVQYGETVLTAINREGVEETGIEVVWDQFARIVGAGFDVSCFMAASRDIADVHPVVDGESTAIFPVNHVSPERLNLVPDVAWLVHAAVCHSSHPHFIEAVRIGNPILR